MNADPKGYYAIIGVPPGASKRALTAAFRRRAKVLHPDVPRTGDAAAFMRLREAYGVLSDADRRREYDVAPPERETAQTGDSAEFAPRPWKDPRVVHSADAFAVPPPLPRWFSALPGTAWGLLAAGALVVASAGVMRLAFSHDPRPVAPGPPPTLAEVTRAPIPGPPAPDISPEPPEPGRLISATHYVLPAGDPATLFDRDPAGDHFVKIGTLVPFTSVEVLRALPAKGFVQVRTPDGRIGFVAGARLTAGDAAAARRGYCIQNAGAPPANGEVFSPRAGGPNTVRVDNRGAAPLMFKLRDANERLAGQVFVMPGESASIGGLPAGAYRPDVATGDLWSRRCNLFMAGMRAQRFAGARQLPGKKDGAGGPQIYEIPPGAGADELIDIPDSAFAEN